MRPNEFIKRLEDSGLTVSAEELGTIAPDATFEQITQELVRECKLTDYQARIVLGKSPGKLRFGDYTILDRIGHGGMGVVFKATKSDGEVVALKVLADRLSRDSLAIRRFMREAEVASQLVHPNIVRAIEYGEHDRQHYFVMEYVDGCNLAESLRARGCGLPLLTAFEYLRHAVRGLEYAHVQNVIHRDIKPSNMLVHRNGTLKILDMGLARSGESDDQQFETELTATGTLLGTTGYMAPEQALNSKNADHRSDIYGLGCTFHFMLTGSEIYHGTTFVEKIVAHREQPIPDLQKLRDDVPTAVQELFAQMVAKDIDQRFQSACELRSEVESLLDEFGHMWMIKRYLTDKKGRR